MDDDCRLGHDPQLAIMSALKQLKGKDSLQAVMLTSRDLQLMASPVISSIDAFALGRYPRRSGHHLDAAHDETTRRPREGAHGPPLHSHLAAIDVNNMQPHRGRHYRPGGAAQCQGWDHSGLDDTMDPVVISKSSSGWTVVDSVIPLAQTIVLASAVMHPMPHSFGRGCISPSDQQAGWQASREALGEQRRNSGLPQISMCLRE